MGGMGPDFGSTSTNHQNKSMSHLQNRAPTSDPSKEGQGPYWGDLVGNL